MVDIGANLLQKQIIHCVYCCHTSFSDVLCCICVDLFLVFIEFSLVMSLDSNKVISCTCYTICLISTLHFLFCCCWQRCVN